MAQRHFLQLGLSPLLLPLSWVYACIMYLRKKLYDFKILKSYKSQVPTICIGNISWGGTGKSPIVDYILTKMDEKQKKAIVLTRGYGAKFENYPLLLNHAVLAEYNLQEHSLQEQSLVFPDEALMLLKKHPLVDIFIDPKRARAAQRVQGVTQDVIQKITQEMEQKQGQNTPDESPDESMIYADFLLMDDGFQHFALERDYNFVLLDKGDLLPQNPLGFLWEKMQNWNRLIPLGTWREQSHALQRASIFLLKCPKNEWNECAVMRESALKKLSKYKKPLFVFQIILDGLENIFKREDVFIPTQDYALLCAVANPEQVQKSVEDFVGYKPTKTLFFPDHHDFKKDCSALHRVLEEMPIVCTEKDAVKLEHFEELRHAKYTVYATKSHVQFYASEFYEEFSLAALSTSSCLSSSTLYPLPASDTSSLSPFSHFDHWLDNNVYFKM